MNDAEIFLVSGFDDLLLLHDYFDGVRSDVYVCWGA